MEPTPHTQHKGFRKRGAEKTAEINPAKLRVYPGRPYPIGPAVYDEAVRFTIFSRHATEVWLSVFNNIDDRTPVWEFQFDPRRHRTGDIWSIFVRGLHSGAYYLYRMNGPRDPAAGHHFNPDRHLLDPYARAFVGDIYKGTMKCVVVHEDLDWAEDQPPRRPMRDTIIYETHVRGFTKHESSGVPFPGTYKGLVDKIPHLIELGVTAVELLPIQEFGEHLMGRCSLVTGQELSNYWGYSNIGFFAPAGRYASSAVSVEHLEEFRNLVAALHLAGIEIILDVVFNHTSEGDERGPTLCFRGIDNSIYYLLDKGAYLNYSGCGNTVNCSHPVVRDFILDCLRYWVAVMHVDGFRFDLASILGRDKDGSVQSEGPLVQRIAEDPVLRDVKLIAEAWDAGGAYQVGSFGGARWAEWNGKYRDGVRRYWRGDPGTRGSFACRLTGSADLYQWADRNPEHSINFITCHDGFTLRDLVSYNQKHNEANGENNRDGLDDNVSCNWGVEGDTDDPDILALRLQMQKNFLATLFLSLGVPMLLGGDEFGRSQGGNNNAYCQDSLISWYDWNLLKENADLFRFTKAAIAFRKANPVLRRAAFFQGQTPGAPRETADILWRDERGRDVDWQSPDTRLACYFPPKENDDTALYLMFNNSPDDCVFQLPFGPWRIRIDTAAPPPNDIAEDPNDALAVAFTKQVKARSLTVLSTPPPRRLL